MENSGFRRTALPCSLCHTQANRRRMLHARRETRPARSVGTSRSEAAARPTQPGGAHSTDGSLAHNDPMTQSPRAGDNSASPLPPRHFQGCRGPAMAALAPGPGGAMGAGACAEVRPAGSAPRGTHTNPKPPMAGLRGSESRQGDKAAPTAGRGLGRDGRPGSSRAAQPPCPESRYPARGGGREAAAVGAGGGARSCTAGGAPPGQPEGSAAPRGPPQGKRNQKGGGSGGEGAGRVSPRRCSARSSPHAEAERRGGGGRAGGLSAPPWPWRRVSGHGSRLRLSPRVSQSCPGRAGWT